MRASELLRRQLKKSSNEQPSRLKTLKGQETSFSALPSFTVVNSLLPVLADLQYEA